MSIICANIDLLMHNKDFEQAYASLCMCDKKLTMYQIYTKLISYTWWYFFIYLYLPKIKTRYVSTHYHFKFCTMSDFNYFMFLYRKYGKL